MLGQQNPGEAISPLAVGALLYAPANHPTIADSVTGGTLPAPYSIALCLEDAISDAAVADAECVAVETIHKIADAARTRTFYRPLLFIRVRTPEQIDRLFAGLQDTGDVLTGFIAPKFSCANAAAYLEALARVNAQAGRRVYLMPILESQDLLNLETRRRSLYAIKRQLDAVRPLILNIRVGGNDFCREFGVRRRCDETIYDIGCVRSILSDIVTCFGSEYVISGPVWEYFHDETDAWRTGLQREVRCDQLNGFIGKTVIHPNQIAVVNNALKVTHEDYADARNLLDMNGDDGRLVAKSAAGSRMNERKTHEKWAWKTLALAEIYGVKQA